MPGIATSPSGHCLAVTASDTVDIATGPTRGILVKTAGDYVLILADDGTSQVTVNLAAGVVHPIRVKRVYSTGSASTSGIVGFW